MTYSKEKQEFLNCLKHYRHDWLNHIQIIKGYLSLDKAEKAQKYLDQVIIQAHYESKISQLGDTDLAYFLLTYNWVQDKLMLDVEIEENDIEIHAIGVKYPYLYTWCKELTRIAEVHSTVHYDNRLSILVEVNPQVLTLTVEFLGGWDSKQAVGSFEQLEPVSYTHLTLPTKA